MKAKFGTLLAAGFAALTLAACGPSYVGMRIGPPPPVPVNAYMGVAPGPGYVWTAGYWDLRGDRWHWVDGRWVVPPRPRAVWVSGYWAPRRGRYYWHPGHWR
jgi:hypothetical protein